VAAAPLIPLALLCCWCRLFVCLPLAIPACFLNMYVHPCISKDSSLQTPTATPTLNPHRSFGLWRCSQRPWTASLSGWRCVHGGGGVEGWQRCGVCLHGLACFRVAASSRASSLKPQPQNQPLLQCQAQPQSVLQCQQPQHRTSDPPPPQKQSPRSSVPRTQMPNTRRAAAPPLSGRGAGGATGSTGCGGTTCCRAGGAWSLRAKG